MTEPLNPYASSPLPADMEPERKPPQRFANRFADAFSLGTHLFFARPGFIIAIVIAVWLPINLWLGYYDLFVSEGDFRKYFRMVRLTEGLLGVLGVGAIVASGIAEVEGRSCTFLQAFNASFAQWAGSLSVVSSATC